MIYHKDVKTKFKTIFARSVLAIMMCIFCVTCTVGCSIFDALQPSPGYGSGGDIGNSDRPPDGVYHQPITDDDDDDEDQDPDEMTEDEKDEVTGGVSVDYVKVLRKPLSYDFDNNVPDVDENGSKRYYNHFSGNILTWLFQVYGNFNSVYDSEYSNFFDQLYQKTQNEKMAELSEDFEKNKDNYLYWYDAIRYRIDDVNAIYQDKNDSSKTTQDLSQAATDSDGNPIIKAYNVETDTSKGWNWGLSLDPNDYLPWIYSYGTVTDSGYNYAVDGTYKFDYNTFNKYYIEDDQWHYFSADEFSSAFNNEDYQIALEYAIYNIVLGITPHNIEVSYASDGTPSVEVEGYEATHGTDPKSSAQVALENIKSTFNDLGSYVGLTPRNKTAIVNYILENVIGKEVVENGAYTVGGINVVVDYCYNDVVTAIVNYCGSLTTIGVASGEETNDSTPISDAYIASEMVDYPFLGFFSYNGYEDAFQGQQPYEYQSAVIIPSRATVVTDIWLDFKYDAGGDGDEIYDPEKYLDITVSIRWNKGDRSEIKHTEQTIRVYDGPADIGGKSTLDFEFEPDTGKYLFGEPLAIGKFNTPDALKTTADMLLPDTTDRGIIVTGMTDARRYYKVLESATYGGYGVLDESKFDCSYLEIAYSVAKKPGDTTTNYAFYTSIHNIFEDDDEDASWMH